MIYLTITLSKCNIIHTSESDFFIKEFDDCENAGIVHRKKRRERNQIKYLVRWVGHGQQEDSWEPANHLANAKELVQKFHLENPNAAGSREGAAQNTKNRKK